MHREEFKIFEKQICETYGGRKQENFSHSGLCEDGTNFQISSYPSLYRHQEVQLTSSEQYMPAKI